ncbi:Uncharacterized protein DBV15_06355 [Temnothorax longispinosus]|uniref:Uncharacterized protein n=1 Tax=Temnothorax longispinosus TaxID=300112 RepID=A0A4V3SCF2_9HYME|nr:Uncharacterized protein DBV15_06355 [Temnothorax longispinosus]
MLEIIISVDSDRRPFFPQCLVYASSGKLRGSGVPAREGHSFEEASSEKGPRKRVRKDTECMKEGERRNKTDREREKLRKRSAGSLVHHDSLRMIKGDPTRASRRTAPVSGSPLALRWRGEEA